MIKIIDNKIVLELNGAIAVIEVVSESDSYCPIKVGIDIHTNTRSFGQTIICQNNIIVGTVSSNVDDVNKDLITGND